MSLQRFAWITALLIFTSCSSGGGSSDSNSGSSGNSNSGSGNNSASNNQLRVLFCETSDLDTGTASTLAGLFSQHSRSLHSRTNSSLAKTITIPVRFHVIREGDSVEQGSVADEVLIEQIDILNRAFSGETGGIATPYRFHLAGIDQILNPTWHEMSPGSASEQDAKRALRVGGAETLNVYVVDIIVPDGGKGTILGYATMPILYKILPKFDGIVLNYRAVPGSALQHYNTGHVLVHEAGHWLGLLHTFTGQCDGAFTDLVSDTPREQTPTSGDFCPAGRDSCPSATGQDPIHNHMTYTGDECRSEFTQGQVNFMEFNTSVFRGLF